jgi:putative tricarboxylic transport membrane protein
MTHDKGDLVAAAVLAAFGIYVIWVAAKLPYVSDVGPGPGFFPAWLGIGMVLFAIGLMFSSFTAAPTKASREPKSWLSLIRPLSGWVAVMAAISLLGRIGFVLSFVILTLFLIIVLDRRPIVLALGIAVGLAVGFHVIFVIALDVSLPKAVWGF